MTQSCLRVHQNARNMTSWKYFFKASWTHPPPPPWSHDTNLSENDITDLINIASLTNYQLIRGVKIISLRLLNGHCQEVSYILFPHRPANELLDIHPSNFNNASIFISSLLTCELQPSLIQHVFWHIGYVFQFNPHNLSYVVWPSTYHVPLKALTCSTCVWLPMCHARNVDLSRLTFKI